jgi:hypothetical protein
MSPLSHCDRDQAFVQVMRLSAMLDSESAHETLADAILSRALFIALDIDASTLAGAQS